MFNPGDKIRRIKSEQNGNWKLVTERKNLSVDMVVTVQELRGERVLLKEQIENQGIGWFARCFEKVMATKPLKEWM